MADRPRVNMVDVSTSVGPPKFVSSSITSAGLPLQETRRTEHTRAFFRSSGSIQHIAHTIQEASVTTMHCLLASNITWAQRQAHLLQDLSSLSSLSSTHVCPAWPILNQLANELLWRFPAAAATKASHPTVFVEDAAALAAAVAALAVLRVCFCRSRAATSCRCGLLHATPATPKAPTKTASRTRIPYGPLLFRVREKHER